MGTKIGLLSLFTFFLKGNELECYTLESICDYFNISFKFNLQRSFSITNSPLSISIFSKSSQRVVVVFCMNVIFLVIFSGFLDNKSVQLCNNFSNDFLYFGQLQYIR